MEPEVTLVMAMLALVVITTAVMYVWSVLRERKPWPPDAHGEGYTDN